MKNRHPALAFSCLLLLVPAAYGQSDPQDIPGSKDYPLFSRFPNYSIDAYEHFRFDSYAYELKDRKEVVEGERFRIDYYRKKDTEAASMLEIIRNYENAIRRAGGEVLYTSGTNYTIGRLAKDGKETWVRVQPWNNGSGIELQIVERRAMEQTVQVNAETWTSDISKSGHATVYGIYFDTDKAEIKAESAPVLTEMGKLLKSNPALNVLIVGHTDNTGTLEHNMKLSEARAASVVNALVAQHGIAATRLTPMGAGPVAPVASNRTEEGRSKNRRVELVER